MADCPVHGVPHRGCDMVPTPAQAEAVAEAIEADEVPDAADAKGKAKAGDA